MTKKLSKYFLFALFLIIFAAPTLSFARGSAPVAVKAAVPDVSSALVDWKDSVEGGDVDVIMALYDKKAIMISTFVQSPITSREGLFGYYKKVVANPDVRVEIEEENPRKFGNMAVNTGRYTLSYTQEGEAVTIPARFSFVYQLQGNKWIIVDQHSSRVPIAAEIK